MMCFSLGAAYSAADEINYSVNGSVYVSADLLEAFFNTVTVSGNSIDISPAMSELE